MNKRKKVNSILFRVAFTMLVLVLFTTHFSAGIAAKFLSTASGQDDARVARFSCSTNVDDYSALTFTNTAFWGGSSTDVGVAMNALRSVTFSVHNWEYVNDSTTEINVNEVASTYELNFSAPANFIEKLAIQLFNKDDQTLMPQFAFHDLIECFHNQNVGGETSSTAQYVAPASAKYNGKHFGLDDVVFDAKKSGDNYVAVSSDKKIEIKLTKFTKQVDQTLYFRLWDVSATTTASNPFIKNEGGALLAPLQLVTNREVDFYKISISLPSEFILPINEAKTDKYLLRIAPTHALFDDHLGMVIPSSTASANFDIANPIPIEVNKTYKASSWMEEIIDKDSSNNVISHNKEAVINPIVPSDGTSTNTNTITETLTEDTMLHDIVESNEAAHNIKIDKGSIVETTSTEEETISGTTEITDTDIKKEYTQTVKIDTTKVYNVTTNGVTTTYTHTSSITVTRTIIYENHNNIEFTPTKILIPSTDTNGKVTYSEQNSFSLFEEVDGVTKQKYFVSECYSKNYPMTVSVTFIQID